jgi:hypothetical protein
VGESVAWLSDDAGGNRPHVSKEAVLLGHPLCRQSQMNSQSWFMCPRLASEHIDRVSYGSEVETDYVDRSAGFTGQGVIKE